MADATTSEELVLMAEGKVAPLDRTRARKNLWRKSLKSENRALKEVNKKLYLENAELRREVASLSMRLKFSRPRSLE